MSDIEQRLRGTYSTGPFGKRDFAPYIPPIQIEAADHIAALEARNARLEEQVREAYERCAQTCESLDTGYIESSPVLRCAQAIRTLTTEQTNG